MTTSSDDQWAVLVRRPGMSDVRIGPVYRWQADDAVAWFRLLLTGTAHPDGTTHEAVPHDPNVPHDPVPPLDPYALADLVRAEDDDAAPAARYPDTWSRLRAFHAEDDTHRAWRAMCWILDEPAEDDANSERDDIGDAAFDPGRIA